MATTTLTLRRGQPELDQMLEKQVPFRIPHGPSKTRLIQEVRKFEAAHRQANDDITRVCSCLEVKRNFTPSGILIDSEIGSASIEEAREMIEPLVAAKRAELLDCFIADLNQGVAAHRIGDIHWSGLKFCEVTFMEKRKSRTLTTNRQHYIRHTHTLVDARKHYLPAHDVAQPRECKRLVKAMETCPWLYRHAYIVTGNHVNSGPSDRQEMEVVETPNELVRAARFLGKAAAVTANGIAAAAITLPVAAGSFAVVGDPALVIGQKWVLCGWD